MGGSPSKGPKKHSGQTEPKIHVRHQAARPTPVSPVREARIVPSSGSSGRGGGSGGGRSDREHVPQGKVHEVVMRVLDQESLKYLVKDGDILCLFGSTESISVLLFNYNERNEVLSIYYFLQQDCPSRMQQNMAEFLCWANFGMRRGFFDMTPNGNTRFTHSVSLSKMSEDVMLATIDKMVTISRTVFLQYKEGIIMVMAGGDPQRACDKSERKGFKHESEEYARHFTITCDGCGSNGFEGRCFECKTCSDYHLCGECFSSRKCTKEHSLMHVMRQFDPASHKGVVCDYCLAENFYLPRFKCTVCRDYDLCGQCFQNKKKSQSHDPSHAMDIVAPQRKYHEDRSQQSGASVVRNLIRQDSRRTSMRLDGRNDARFANTVEMEQMGGDIPSHHLQVDFRNERNRLGKGGMGEVYRGELSYTPVAVKVLPCLKTDPASIADFKKEVRLHAQLKHPHIVQIMGVCVKDERLCLVQELCGKRSLANVLAEEPTLTFDMRLRMSKEATLGMCFLHMQKIVHLDLKPLNLLVTDDYRIKVADFGLSQRMDLSKSHVDVMGGTLMYMAPELFGEHPRGTNKCDCFAFGIILYELFVGEPYKGKIAHPSLFFHLVTSGVRPDIPAGTNAALASLMKSLWSKTPQDRPEFHIVRERLAAV